jgi:hypothetical protein
LSGHLFGADAAKTVPAPSRPARANPFTIAAQQIDIDPAVPVPARFA